MKNIDLPKTFSFVREYAIILLEDAEDKYEGGRDQFRACIKLCEVMAHVRITYIRNGIAMPVWYSKMEERLKVMYKWHLDLDDNGVSKYILNPW